MRGQAVALTLVLGGVLAAPARAQSDEEAAAPRTAEQFLETAREVYSVREKGPEPCTAPTGNEIVVCRERLDPETQRLPSPTERANAAGVMPPDPIPQAPYVLGLPECGVEVVCHRVGRAPPPIYIIDLSKIPQALTPEEAAHVFRAEDLPAEPATPEAASPAAAP
jgi:hypothetical protein